MAIRLPWRAVTDENTQRVIKQIEQLLTALNDALAALEKRVKALEP